MVGFAIALPTLRLLNIIELAKKILLKSPRLKNYLGKSQKTIGFWY